MAAGATLAAQRAQVKRAQDRARTSGARKVAPDTLAPAVAPVEVDEENGYSAFMRSRTKKSKKNLVDDESEVVKKDRLKKASRLTEKGFVIDPRSARWMQQWDIIMMLLLIFTALVTPAEVSTPCPRMRARGAQAMGFTAGCSEVAVAC
jgi:hypothetical protein